MAKTGSRFGSKRKRSMYNAEMNELDWKHPMCGGCKSGDEDNAVGYDAGKKVKGRKLHALVDVEGLPLRVVLHSELAPLVWTASRGI